MWQRKGKERMKMKEMVRGKRKSARERMRQKWGMHRKGNMKP